MDGNTREIALAKELVEFRSSESTLDKNDDLVEFENVEQVVQLPVLLTLAELNVVLLEAVKSELRIVINVNFKRILHKFLANWSNLLRECGAEHHHLFLGWRSSENLLHISTHICWLQ